MTAQGQRPITFYWNDSYLNQQSISTAINNVRETDNPESSVMDMAHGILQWYFMVQQNFLVTSNRQYVNQIPDVVVLKCRLSSPGHSDNYDYLFCECKPTSWAWRAIEDQLHNALNNTENESKQLYGLAVRGKECRFYIYDGKKAVPKQLVNLAASLWGNQYEAATYHILDHATATVDQLFKHIIRTPLPVL